MGVEVLKKFDRYFLLDCIAQGGMAEIFRARLASNDGASRLVVIKRILADYGKNRDFIRMFKSEIKVLMGFNHPNIVQLYDFGEVGKQPFIAMELVDGKNLRQVITRCCKDREGTGNLPVELGVYLIEQAAMGLHYAHAFKDKLTGEPLNIVHRDVSPQNLLVSYEGNVKVIDFGIAKVATTGESTRVGVIKGKPSYLSPEQVMGLKLDARCDVFSLGTVLWEVLTGRKLFAVNKGENEFAVLKLIESCQTYVKPPSKLNPEIPKELDYVVLKALAKDREKRYQSAEEFQRELHKFLYSFAPDFTPSDLGFFVKNLFKDDIVDDRKMLQALNARVERLMESEVSFVTGSFSQAGRESDPEITFVDPRASVKEGVPRPPVEIDMAKVKSNAKVEIEAPSASNAVAHGSLSAVSSAANTATKTRTDAHVSRFLRNNSTNEDERGRGSKVIYKLIALGAVAGVALLMILPNYVKQIPWLQAYFGGTEVETPGEVPPAQSQQPVVSNVAMPVIGDASKPMIVLTFDVKPNFGGSQITLNGKPLNGSNPRAKVALDEPLELVVRGEQFNTFRREFVLDSRENTGKSETTMDVPLEPLQFGYITIYTTPSAQAKIQNRTLASQNQQWIRPTPLEQEKLPVGTYVITLENTVLGLEKTVTIQVEPGRTTKVNETLANKR